MLFGGRLFLPYHDKSPPATINKILNYHVSKNKKPARKRNPQKRYIQNKPENKKKKAGNCKKF